MPSGRRTSSAPPSSIPAPVPAPPAQRTGRSSSASRARSAARQSRAGCVQPRGERAQELVQRGLERAARPPERRRAVAQLRRQVGRVDRDVDADPQHRPALLRPRLDEHARELAPAEEDVVRPLDLRVRAREVGDGEPGAQRQQVVVLAQHERAEQRAARRRGPRAALAPAPGGLDAGAHERPVRRSGEREVARAVVRRRRRAQVQPRAADHGAARVSSSPGRTSSRRAARPVLTAIAAIRAASSNTSASPGATSANVRA